MLLSKAFTKIKMQQGLLLREKIINNNLYNNYFDTYKLHVNEYINIIEIKKQEKWKKKVNINIYKH